MASDITYVTSFRQLELSEPVRDFELLPGVHVTNDGSVIRHLLTPDYARHAGFIEVAHLQAAGNAVFGEFPASAMLGGPVEPFLMAILLWIEGLFDNAWLLKDHAMRCEAAHLAYRAPRGTIWTSNFLATRPSFADGTVEQTIAFSLADLIRWADMNERIETYLHEAQSARTSFMMEKGYRRSGRAMRFVKAARAAPDMAFKISHYCSALETLFTTETTELSHKLSERVAFFLGLSGHRRPVVFKTVKRAYAVRSKLVHGDTLTARQIDELPELSVQLDSYLRAILNAVFAKHDLKRVFDSHTDAVEKYFLKLILGGDDDDA